MYPVLQQQAMLYDVAFRRNTCCITNQNQKQQHQQRRSNSARDRVIDFGKYKGKMLGSLPSTYLKWVSKNLRARDFEEWAILADQVLVDPIYRDRIEWEFALDVLDGNCARLSSTGSADSKLHEISERFGWDNLDKIGWSKVDFDLLGTSKGGRIPRLDNRNPSDADAASESNKYPRSAKYQLTPTDATDATTGISSNSSNRSRRTERREKLKLKMRTTTQEAQQQHKEDDTTVAADIKQQVAAANPFPGRQALLRKAINHRAQS
ncbi:uncharacterized protein LOC131653995 [Vicia villosa]|uniref:uncharacterized protein LOC131653995 n=1 Tax=Vicia villosa TaxID=3911 RepID=UPI00273ACC53|nr:uncharacterized protein LOC131653995 [Vicia villosa]